MRFVEVLIKMGKVVTKASNNLQIKQVLFVFRDFSFVVNFEAQKNFR